MENKKLFNNDPTCFFLNQEKTMSPSKKKKAIEYSNKLINMNNCPICEETYDLALRTPRIIVSCGHTFCTSCLFLFFKDYRVKCPTCLKTVKRLLSIEVLPINHIIYKELIKKLPAEKILEKNSKLRLPKEVIEELEKEEVDLPVCIDHNERYKHFFIPTEKKLVCRACIKEGDYNEDEIQDLYSMHKEDIEKILSIVENNN